MNQVHQPSSETTFPLAEAAYAQVVFNLPRDEPFTYRIPEAFRGQVQPGMRVTAPFGKRRLTGYVVAVQNEFNGPYELKDLADVPDTEPVLSPELMALTQWVASYYHAGWGEAIKAALPAGLEEESLEVFFLSETGVEALRHPNLPPRTRRLLESLCGRKPATRKQLRRLLPGEYSAHVLNRLRREGLVDSVIHVRQSTVPYLQEKRARRTNLPPEEAETLLRKSPRQKEVYEFLAECERPLSALAKAIPNYNAALQQLKKKGLVDVYTERVARKDDTESADIPGGATTLTLTSDQQAVFKKLSACMNEGKFGAFLLHGVTGSGKTEIYMRCIQQALAQNKTAIMMVPEISLTPQTVYLFQQRFGRSVAILHSGLSNAERYLEWKKIREGKVSIAVGARSAVFAPFKNLGVVIIDEEHDASYKQQTSPRYHARDTAIQRARGQDALVILGSATPSLESRRKADTGEYHYMTLDRRIGERLLPVVRVVDMRRERDELRNYSVLSTNLKQAIAERLERQEQVFLFLNRRGTANYVVCRKCGFVFECPRCSVSLTFHGPARTLLCHYCSFSLRMPGACTECGGEVIRFSGFGTQKLEEETRALFPQARILRLDRDTTRSRTAFQTMYRDMGAGNIDILIGTQMITKGHDFPNVTLVGVVYADLSLHIPDFRSCERSFQLLTQVAGRAGRGKVPGQVIVQAHDPDHPLFECVSRHDYARFYESELALRERLHYPPFTRLALIEIESEDEAAAEAAARRLKTALSSHLRSGSGVELLGPARAALYRINNRYRWHAILRAKHIEPLQKLATHCRQLREMKPDSSGKVKITLDIDPVNML